jgi:hypothetical protein
MYSFNVSIGTDLRLNTSYSIRVCVALRGITRILPPQTISLGRMDTRENSNLHVPHYIRHCDTTRRKHERKRWRSVFLACTLGLNGGGLGVVLGGMAGKVGFRRDGVGVKGQRFGKA